MLCLILSSWVSANRSWHISPVRKVRAMPQISTSHRADRRAFPRITPPGLSSLFAWLVILSIWPPMTLAEVRIVTAQGEHRMRDRDTREDAIRLATEAAKRNALEQVTTYLESITVVDGLDVTKDEIRTYTAGLVLVLEQDTNTMLDGNTIVVRTNLVAQVDTEEVRHAIAALRENEDARHQLVALQQENDHLQQDLDAANQALAKASTIEQTQQAAQQRTDILNRVQSNAMVSQAWTDWVLLSPAVYPYPLVGPQTQALLNVARGLYPTSPHVQVAQQVFITRQPPVPPQPPAPPAPGMKQPTMPSLQIVPYQRGSRPGPFTLNEISHATLAGPPQIGGSRASSSHDAPPNSKSARALQLFLRQEAGQSPTTSQLPQTIDQTHPPSPNHVPRIPYYQAAPRTPGGGVHSGGGGGEGR